MKPLILLLSTFLLSLVAIRLFAGVWNEVLAGNIAMSVMLIATGLAHFALSKGMAMMMPIFIPFKREMVYLTGIIELAAAAGILIPSLRHTTAVLLIIFFILVLPANIYAAVKKVNYEKGTFNGPGLTHLWFRIPLQLFFIGWVYWFALR